MANETKITEIVGQSAYDQLEKLDKAMAQAQARLNGFAKDIGEGIKFEPANLTELVKKIDDFDRNIKSLSTSIKDINSINQEYHKSIEKVASSMQKATKSSKERAKSTKEVIDIEKKMADNEKEIARIAQESEAIITVSDTKIIKSKKELVSAWKQLIALDTKKVMQDVTDGALTEIDALEELSTQMRKIRHNQFELDEALSNGTISMQDHRKATDQLIKKNDELDDTYSVIKSSIKDIPASMKVAEDAFSNLSEGVKEQYTSLVALQSEQKNIESSLKSLDQQFKSGSLTQEEYILKQAELKALQSDQQSAIKKLSEELKLNTQLLNTQIGSYDNLSAQYSLLKKKINEMGEAEGQNTKEKRSMEKQAEKIYSQMNKLQTATGKYTLQVGNYNIASKDLIKTLQLVNPAFASAATSAAAFGKQMLALLANPIVLLIAAIVVAITALVAAFNKSITAVSKNEEEYTKLQQAMSPIRYISDQIDSAFKELGKTFIEVTSFLTGLIAKATDYIGLTENMQGAVEDYNKIEQERLNLARRARVVNEINAKNETKIAELRDKAAQKDLYNNKERLGYLNQALKLEENRYLLEKKLKDSNVTQIQNEINIRGLQGETEWIDKLSKARIEADKANTELFKKQRTINREKSALIKEGVNEEREAAKTNLKIERDLQAASIKLMKDGFEKEYAEREQSYQQRIDQAKLTGKRVDEQVRAIEMEREKDLAEFKYQYQAKMAMANAQNYLAITEKNSIQELDARLDILQLQRTAELKEAEKTGAEKVRIEEKYNREIQQLYIDFAKIQLSQEESQNELLLNEREIQLNEEIAQLEQQYAKGLVKKREYEQKKSDLEYQFSISSLNTQIDLLEKSLDIFSGEDRLNMEKQISALRVQLSNEETNKIISNLDKEKKAREDIEKAKMELITESVKAIADIGNSMFQSTINNLDAEIRAYNEAYNERVAKIDQLASQDAITKEEAEARKRAAEAETSQRNAELEKKKAELQTKQAKFQKAMNIAQVIAATAVAITESLPNFILAGLVAGMGAIQLATILAQPIPKYAKGTDFHPGGFAIVGDGGKQEGVFYHNKAYITPDKPTLIDLPKGAEVIPNIRSKDFYDRILDNSYYLTHNKNGDPVNIVNTFDAEGIIKANDGVRREIKILSREVIKNGRTSSFWNYINHKTA